jgi:hypothetical protein
VCSEAVPSLGRFCFVARSPIPGTGEENKRRIGRERALSYAFPPLSRRRFTGREKMDWKTFTSQRTMKIDTHDVFGAVEFPEGMNHQRVESSPKRLPQLS